jgi:hypothetical protein
MKDSERAPYNRFIYQFLLALFLGYYSLKMEDLWKTFIAMSNPGQFIRSIVGTIWEWAKYGLFYYDTQYLYGSELHDDSGENFFSSIFSSLGLPETSVGWNIWNFGIVIFAAFSTMSMIFPDHDTPVKRFLTYMTRDQNTAYGIWFRVYLYAFFALFVGLAYKIFLICQTSTMSAEFIHHDLHFLWFFTAFRFAILAFKALDYILSQFKAWWIRDSNDDSDGLQEPLMNNSLNNGQINDDLEVNNY